MSSDWDRTALEMLARRRRVLVVFWRRAQTEGRVREWAEEYCAALALDGVGWVPVDVLLEHLPVWADELGL